MKPTTELPKWVPTAMATHYNRILTGEDGEVWKNGPFSGGFGLLAEYGYPKAQLAPTITSLCENPEMEQVWRRLCKAFEEQGITNWESNFLYYLLFSLYQRSPWDSMTRKERRSRHEDAQNALHEAAKLLRDCDLDRPVWEFILPPEFEGAIDRHLYTDFKPQYWESDIEGHDEPSLFLCGNPPYVSDVIDRLKDVISEERAHESALVARESTHGNDYVIFTRRMGSYFTQFLGSPHYENVAALVRVLLEVDVDENTVYKTIAGSPPDKEGVFRS
ncbi:hypothetical protein [Microbulbifer agarilyticus]|uniref:hypothetical protein n=1 Tax=Microbulbifer agarilyticus TaxID=260552 RepID=UPI001CD41583|nr:hypothetical protein [Microbulbifer agarilyticus]MCA0892850.1 hypothetical protein [Microbulbifer agarilyticus]